MLSWERFEAVQPELARLGTDLLYHFGVGLAFLGTVRRDGGPRLHPICPLRTETGLYAFIIPSPKQRDLQRDPRFALHSFPMEDNEDAFYLAGETRHVSEPDIRARLTRQFVEERSKNFAVPAPAPDHELFEFLVQVAMLTRTTGHGDSNPQHTVWRHG